MKYFLFVLCFAPSIVVAQSATQDAENFIRNYQFENALRVLLDNYDTLNISLQQQAGYCYFRLGNYKKAIQCYEGALKVDSTDRTSLNQLGQLYARNNEHQKALSSYRKLISFDSLNSFYCKQYASLSVDVNEVTEALIYYRKTLQLNPLDMEAYLGFGNILLDIEAYPSLDSVIENGLKHDPDNQSLKLLKARSLYEQGNYKEVVKIVDKLLPEGDTLLVHARLLGTSYFQLKDYTNVIKCMNFLLNAGQESEWIYYYLGISNHHLGELTTSIRYLNKAVEKGISENVSTYYTQLGQSYEDNKEFKNAIRCYKAAYESSKSGILLYHLARNYDLVYKDKSQAASYYRRYLNSNDTIKVAREYSQKRLNSLTDYK